MTLTRKQIKAIKAKGGSGIRITKPKGAIEAINLSKSIITPSERARLIKLVKSDAKDQNLKIETKQTPKETILLIKK